MGKRLPIGVVSREVTKEEPGQLAACRWGRGKRIRAEMAAQPYPGKFAMSQHSALKKRFCAHLFPPQRFENLGEFRLRGGVANPQMQRMFRQGQFGTAGDQQRLSKALTSCRQGNQVSRWNENCIVRADTYTRPVQQGNALTARYPYEQVIFAIVDKLQLPAS
ncbi:hypothetical protein ACFORG_19710 [Lutimaribacter marinistellae]|uniref:Uncharacterized protein n=1 Tax=Lutimaribacter marinistellae TaxID=1820329 RepID=A0ABV7TLT0_9RHOB